MKNKSEEVIKVKKGRFKGQDFRVEGRLDEYIDDLANMGNMAAVNAIKIDKYHPLQDVPFFYGKIGSLGYILSGNDLEEKPTTPYVMPKY